MHDPFPVVSLIFENEQPVSDDECASVDIFTRGDDTLTSVDGVKLREVSSNCPVVARKIG